MILTLTIMGDDIDDVAADDDDDVFWVSRQTPQRARGHMGC